MGIKYKFGNTLYRLKLQCWHIMLKYGLDPDTYASSIPDKYVKKQLKIEDLEMMGNKCVHNNAEKEIVHANVEADPKETHDIETHDMTLVTIMLKPIQLNLKKMVMKRKMMIMLHPIQLNLKKL